MDGVQLDKMTPGSVREVSPSIGSWLIIEGYAEPEMRNASDNRDDDLQNMTSMNRRLDDVRRRQNSRS